MAKRSPAQPKVNLGTFFLARNSRLFRPGAEFILATALPSARTSHPSQDIRHKRPVLGSGSGGGASYVAPAGGGGPIAFAALYGLYAPNNPVAWPCGTASAPGTTGVPAWSLSNNDGGNFQIDAATGIVSKLAAGVLTTVTHSFTISVSGVTPAPADQVIFLPVAPSMDFRQPGNSMLAGA